MVEYQRDSRGRVEARDDDRAPGVVGRGASERGAAADLEKLIIQTWHPARVGRLQEAIDLVMASDVMDSEEKKELQRFFDDSIGFHRSGPARESWESQERANARPGNSYTNSAE